jgi:GNAT superfamily N-acetyltransferase
MVWQVDLPGGFAVSDDPGRLDLDMVHRYLAEESYWARGRTRAAVERSVANSLCLGLYAPDGGQAGFARAITDRAVYAHLADVFVCPQHRGRGLGQALVAALLDHPELRQLACWTLSTRDAQGLYARFGFAPHPEPATQMVWYRYGNAAKPPGG